MVAPKAAAQNDLLKRAYGQHDAPGDLIYIEAHGSGTRSGDEAEWSAIAEFAAGRSAPLAIGSVKPNVGHLEPAAGVVGLIKVALCAAYGRIPPTLNSSNPRFQSQFLQVQSETSEWPLETIAGVTSLGMTGSNCHIVVGRPPCSAKLPEGVPPPPYLFLMSARTSSALQRIALSTAQWCADWQDSDLYGICYTAAHRRALLEVRAALVVRSIEDLRSKLVAFGNGRVEYQGSDRLYSALDESFPVEGNVIGLPPYPWERQLLKTELMNDASEQVRRITSQILEIPEEALEPNARLIELGLDSLRALELENRLMGDLGVEIPASDLLSPITLLELTAIVEPRASVCP
jgi:acyl carrier protein